MRTEELRREKKRREEKRREEIYTCLRININVTSIKQTISAFTHTLNHYLTHIKTNLAPITQHITNHFKMLPTSRKRHFQNNVVFKNAQTDTIMFSQPIISNKY